MKKNVAVFSSGRGGNFNNLCDYFNNSNRIVISLLITNNLDSMSKKIADRNNIETVYVNYEIMSSESFEKSLIKRRGQLFLVPQLPVVVHRHQHER